jgi:hypothetical protein
MAAIGTAAERKRLSSVDPAFTAKTLAAFIIRSGKYRKHGKSGQDLRQDKADYGTLRSIRTPHPIFRDDG